MSNRTKSGYRLNNDNLDWVIQQAEKLDISGADLLNVIIYSLRVQNPNMVRLVLQTVIKPPSGTSQHS